MRPTKSSTTAIEPFTFYTFNTLWISLGHKFQGKVQTLPKAKISSWNSLKGDLDVSLIRQIYLKIFGVVGVSISIIQLYPFKCSKVVQVPTIWFLFSVKYNIHRQFYRITLFSAYVFWSPGSSSSTSSPSAYFIELPNVLDNPFYSEPDGSLIVCNFHSASLNDGCLLFSSTAYEM